MSAKLPYKLGIQQRVLPAYRADFFDLLQVARLTLAENIHLGRGRLYACVQKNLIAWLEQWTPDVLVAEANPRYLKTPAALRWMKSQHRPVIGWGLGAPPLRGFWRRMLRERFLSGFDALLTYSQLGAEQYRAAGFPAERIFVAPNAVSPRPKNTLPVRPDQFTFGRGHVLFVGRLQPRKRIDLLLSACAALPANLQPRLTIVGDGPARADLQALAAQIYPLTVFTGELHGAALEPYFVAADLFVLPGTGGLAVQQAMAWGLPVMVAEADGTQADLVRASNGWMLPPGNVEALRQQLAEAFSNPDRLRRMGAESFRIVDEEINLEAMVQAFRLAVEAVKNIEAR
jgi:glycosyltransferase involved in cell wall biosynthesis